MSNMFLWVLLPNAINICWDNDFDNSLLIVLDTPKVSRIDIEDLSKYKTRIKIDHHPFEEKFCDKNGSCICREILGYNLSIPEEMEKIQEEKLLETKCPKVVLSACDILEEMI